jgi:hypothetical protein
MSLLHQLAVMALRILFFGGLAVAYASAAAGLLGVVETQSVTKLILLGTIAAFVAMIFYYGLSDWELRRRLRQQLGH